ncbi:MAG: transcription antitermination factor NusB [Phycisphaeraceae bacterium]|nr:transcription antitermination factor NusB [Phycisphaeraceae bacterium]
MATPREIRRLAFQVLYQLDARNGQDPEAVLATTMTPEEDSGDKTDFTEGERRKAFELGSAAFAAREKADAFMVEAAPGWPAHRQAAVDRAILRLAHYEMTSGRVAPKIAVNEAVELAKTFSTDKSPAFVNGLLDKLLKTVLAERGESAEPEPAADPAAEGGAPIDAGTVEAA